MSPDQTLSTADDVAQRVRSHSFSPVDNGFTVDPETGYDGVFDLQSSDWHVRTLALRDLVRLGRQEVSPVLGMLDHDDGNVRQIAATVLGILGAESAADPLSRRLGRDPDPVVRSHAAIALGQIGVSRDAVEGPLETEVHTDVRHQCAVALDRIQKNKPVEPEVADQFAALDEGTFGRVRTGEPAPDFTLDDTEGENWSLSDVRGEKTVVLIWIFADWCPSSIFRMHDQQRSTPPSYGPPFGS